jgi:hypothetical protein
MGHFNGVGVTHDGGINYKGYGPSKDQLDPQTYPARYASFPSEKVWYVSFGSFPSAPPPAPSDGRSRRRINKKLSVYFDHNTTETSFTYDMPTDASPKTTDGSCTAAIAKTTDAGATWEVLFTNVGGFYFNEIDCFSETHCVAVAEGDNGWIFTTRDGGKTWNKEIVEIGEHGSCMGAQMLSETEVRYLYLLYLLNTKVCLLWSAVADDI